VKNQDPLLNIPDAAEYLNQTERWMKRAVEHRWIPFVKMGGQINGKIYFLQSDLDAYVASRVIPSASDR
jgi:hypothetical protein